MPDCIAATAVICQQFDLVVDVLLSKPHIRSMSYKGEIELPAPPPRVWAALHDTKVMQACMPGCQALEWISDTELEGAVRIGGRLIGVTVVGQISLSNQVPDTGYTITGRGVSGVAAGASGSADVTLVERNGNTLLRYMAGGDLGDSPSAVLDNLLDMAAGRIASTFFNRLCDHLANE